MKRCEWSTSEEIYVKYHDEEWGVPVYDDRLLFEMLTLEGAQAGLSWITILKKRENYKAAFDNFDVKKIANYDEEKVQSLLENKGIVRNKLKINSTITNAKAFIEIQKEFGSFSKFLWEYVNNQPIINNWTTINELPAKTDLSDKLSKDLKKRGFKFVGSTIIYAYLQGVGLVNDHIDSCFRKSES
ncbi:DNA-3-methyladenine glycosylase I [Lottiidibacillus patelloidae]|uniref:DNA-3-methyladenine glycosylase I n=1 Tax=Lottiidibacillus patelloidae TaxID=2670334 RepID=A0A263BRD4_9BACI|nr:DNA-3-methyladenine glycosylase I [Lottiidibacillus patelloidae]OZM55937.1 DNA-3-methyladenine glycosylase I [Lottiidibacillus patelloidae]